MAVPKTIATRCRDGSVHVKTCYTKTTQVTPSLHLFFKPDIILWLCYEITGKSTLKQKKTDVRMGLLV